MDHIHLISRARHALTTGQYRLARLYMTKALELLKENR